MSGPDARLEARDQFDPTARAKEARTELERQQALVASLKKTIDQGHKVIKRSQELLRMIPDKW